MSTASKIITKLYCIIDARVAVNIQSKCRYLPGVYFYNENVINANSQSMKI